METALLPTQPGQRLWGPPSTYHSTFRIDYPEHYSKSADPEPAPRSMNLALRKLPTYRFGWMHQPPTDRQCFQLPEIARSYCPHFQPQRSQQDSDLKLLESRLHPAMEHRHKLSKEHFLTNASDAVCSNSY